jgi:mono/diheme cytochrome c family protein
MNRRRLRSEPGARPTARRAPRLLVALVAVSIALCAAALFVRRARRAAGWRHAQEAYFRITGESGEPAVRLFDASWESDGKGGARVTTENCGSCHLGADDARFAGPDVPRELRTHPEREKILGPHPVARFGCTSCHDGSGTLEAPHGASLLSGDLAQASCFRCHARDAALDERAPLYAQGRRLFRKLRCDGCHPTARMPEALGAPPLDELGAKMRPSLIRRWIRDPRSIRASATMPSYPREEESLDIATFLVERSEHPKTGSGPRTPSGSRPSENGTTRIAGESARQANVPGASADDGKALFDSIGCKRCHAPGVSGPPLAVPQAGPGAPDRNDLEGAGDALFEDWTAYWLLDPQRVWPGARMPSLRLDRREAASIAKYIGTLRSRADEALDLGRRQERVKCNVPAAGSGPSSPSGPRTSSYDAEMTRVQCGEALAEAYGCFGCHAMEGQERKTIGRVLEGKRTLDGHVPEYALSAGDTRALVVFLAGLTSRGPRLDFDPSARPSYEALLEGGQILEDARCAACHEASADPAAAGPQTRRAPSLANEGARAQAEWIFAFLENPGALGVRPGLHPEWVYGNLVPLDKLALRMPTFALSSAELTAITRYLATRDGGEFPYARPRPRAMAPEDRLAALMQLNGSGCVKCHYVGDLPVERAKGEGELAPSLAVGRRLRPAWVLSFLRAPGAGHPALGKDATGLRDFLFLLTDKTVLPKPGDEQRSPLLGLGAP